MKTSSALQLLILTGRLFYKVAAAFPKQQVPLSIKGESHGDFGAQTKILYCDLVLYAHLYEYGSLAKLSKSGLSADVPLLYLGKPKGGRCHSRVEMLPIHMPMSCQLQSYSAMIRPTLRIWQQHVRNMALTCLSVVRDSSKYTSNSSAESATWTVFCPSGT